MIYLFCSQCVHGLRVSPGNPGEAEALLGEQLFPCWKCGHALEVSDVETEGVDYTDVNPQEAYAAINGLGLPNEKECSAAAVSKLLTDKKVVRVAASQIRNSHRCVVEYLELEDGERVYLGSSAYGATVYRVSERTSYVEKVDG